MRTAKKAELPYLSRASILHSIASQPYQVVDLLVPIVNIQMEQNSIEPEQNKNWVTVRDKCPQINVKFKWQTFLKKIKNRTNGLTDKRTHERTDGWTDGPILLCPKFYWGAQKYHEKC